MRIDFSAGQLKRGFLCKDLGAGIFEFFDNGVGDWVMWGISEYKEFIELVKSFQYVIVVQNKDTVLFFFYSSKNC